MAQSFNNFKLFKPNYKESYTKLYKVPGAPATEPMPKPTGQKFNMLRKFLKPKI